MKSLENPAQNKYTTSQEKLPPPLPSDPVNNRPKKRRGGGEIGQPRKQGEKPGSLIY